MAVHEIANLRRLQAQAGIDPNAKIVLPQEVCPENPEPLPLHTVLPTDSWKGRRCFIIGGGPSLKGFDWNRLKGELVIGINRAYEVFDCAVLFSMDTRAWGVFESGERGPVALERWENYKGIRCWLRTVKSFPTTADLYQITCPGRDAFTEKVEEGLGGGQNSGYGALNLAVNLGASPIYLLGYDMKGENGVAVHWHNGYHVITRDSCYTSFIERYENVADLINRRAKVINLNKDSALSCFEFGDFEDIKPIQRPIVVSYFTEGTEYEKHAKQLEASARKFGLEVEIEGVPNLGSWQRNTHFKARFIHQKIQQHTDRGLLWIDADAKVLNYPEFFDNFDHNKFDLGVFYRQRLHAEELLSGTLYISPTSRAKKAMYKGIDMNETFTTEWDQSNLQRLLDEFEGIRVERMPPEYCCIFDSMIGEISSDPVIEHYQASRKLKRTIDK